MGKVKWFFKRIQGRIRLFFGVCPECNSDSPKMYNCFVCDKGLFDLFNNKGSKGVMWERFILKKKKQKK